nr:hypothetical protein [Tanacetum cinerariifolium]
MVNVIPPNHVDDVHVVEPDQHGDVSIVLEPVLLDEDEDPEEDEFEKEEDPQEEEDDIESEPEDAIKVENPIKHEDETVLASIHEVGESSTTPFLYENSDGLLPGLMRRDINSFFSRLASLSRRLYGREKAHALVEKKGKVKDEFYGKLIFDLINEVRSSVEQGSATMENLVEKLGNAKDKVECKKLEKKLEEARIMPLKFAPLNQAAIRQMIKDNVDAAIAAERGRQANVRNEVSGSGPVRGQDAAHAAHEPANLNEAVRMAHKLMDQKAQARDERILEGNKQKWEIFQNVNSSGKGNQRDNSSQTLKNNQRQGNTRAMVTAPTDERLPLCERCFTRHVGQCTIKCHKCGKVGHKSRNRCPKKVKQEEVGEVCGRAYAIKDTEPKSPNVVT